VGITHQAGQGLGATGLGSAGFHQHHGGRRVVDARSVASGHGAVFLEEHGFELGHVFELAAGAEVLVGRIRHVPLLAFEHDGHDLVLEAALGSGFLGAVVAFDGQCVLHLAGDAVLGGHVLGGHAHVDVVEGVVQGADHHVDHLGVTHADAPARSQAGVGRTAHVFGAAANGDVAVAQGNGLAGAHDGLQARAAQAVDVEGRGGFGAATVDGGHAREVHVLGLGVDHMTEHHMADILAFGVGAGQGFAHDQGGQLGGWNVLEAATKGTNGGAHTADNNNFTAHGRVSSGLV